MPDPAIEINPADAHPHFPSPHSESGGADAATPAADKSFVLMNLLFTYLSI
jgi:hypothetical protein